MTDGHKSHLDPRAMLVGTMLLVVAAALTSKWSGLMPVAGFTIAVSAWVQIPFSRLKTVLVGLSPLILITLMMHSFLTPGDALWTVSGITLMTVQGLARGAIFSVKIIILSTILIPLLTTIHPRQWGKLFDQATTRHPRFRAIAAAFGMALGFLPLLTAEAERIRLAQTGRGLKVTGSITHRIKTLFPMLAPLLVSIVQKSETITISLQSRGYNLDRPRTVYHPLRFKRIDLLHTIFSLILAIWIIWNR